jgi:hypothetical protein
MPLQRVSICSKMSSILSSRTALAHNLASGVRGLCDDFPIDPHLIIHPLGSQLLGRGTRRLSFEVAMVA